MLFTKSKSVCYRGVVLLQVDATLAMLLLRLRWLLVSDDHKKPSSHFIPNPVALS